MSVLETYVLRSVWHVVKAGPVDGPVVGRFYMFRCYRWATAAQSLAIAHGSPTGSTPVCGDCQESLNRALAGGGADTGMEQVGDGY